VLLCLQISIEPNEAGTFTAQLQVYSVPVVCEVQPMMHSLGPVLALNVVAEEPKVEVCRYSYFWYFNNGMMHGQTELY